MDIRKILLIALLSGGLLLGAFYMDSAAAVQTTFLYNLSNLNGPIKSNGASISIDKERDEIYVVDPEERDIGIFNETGMEVFRFGGDGNLGSVVDVDVDGDGNILVLSKGLNQSSIIICDFRGEPVSVLEIKNLPWDFSSFIPDRLVCRYGRIYLLDSKSLRIAITNAEGFFETGTISRLFWELKKRKGAIRTSADSVSILKGTSFLPSPYFFLLSSSQRTEN